MNAFLRLLCYNDPSSHTSIQLHPDIPMEYRDLPHLTYGQDMRVGSDDTDPLFWPIYLIANIPFMQEIDDPSQPDKEAILLSVYLIKEESWDYFDVPQQVKFMLDFDLEEELDTF